MSNKKILVNSVIFAGSLVSGGFISDSNNQALAQESQDQGKTINLNTTNQNNNYLNNLGSGGGGVVKSGGGANINLNGGLGLGNAIAPSISPSGQNLLNIPSCSGATPYDGIQVTRGMKTSSRAFLGLASWGASSVEGYSDEESLFIRICAQAKSLSAYTVLASKSPDAAMQGLYKLQELGLINDRTTMPGGGGLSIEEYFRHPLLMGKDPITKRSLTRDQVKNFQEQAVNTYANILRGLQTEVNDLKVNNSFNKESNLNNLQSQNTVEEKLLDTPVAVIPKVTQKEVVPTQVAQVQTPKPVVTPVAPKLTSKVTSKESTLPQNVVKVPESLDSTSLDSTPKVQPKVVAKKEVVTNVSQQQAPKPVVVSPKVTPQVTPLPPNVVEVPEPLASTPEPPASDPLAELEPVKKLVLADGRVAYDLLDNGKFRVVGEFDTIYDSTGKPA